jgi:hypothetical protein
MFNEGIALVKYFDAIINNYDIVYFFNGRMLSVRIPLRLCQKYKINCISMEYGNGNTLVRYMNTYPQDPNFWQRESYKIWIKAQKQKYSIAKTFFIERINRTDIYKFTQFQKYNCLPLSFNKNDYNIGVFSSTGIEYSGIPEYEKYPMPNSCFLYYIYLLSLLFANNEHYQFYYRAHPTKMDGYSATHKPFVINTDARNIRILFHMNLPNLHIILPHSEVDSYKLAMSSNLILVSDSTIGLEAAYWGKPVVSIGNSFYKTHNTAYTPTSFTQLIDLMNNKSLTPKPKCNTLVLAYYLKTRGERFTVPDYWFWNISKYYLFFKKIEIYCRKINHNLKKILSMIFHPVSFLKSVIRKIFNKSELIHIKDIDVKDFDWTEVNNFYNTIPSTAEIEKFKAECIKVAERLEIHNLLYDKLI